MGFRTDLRTAAVSLLNGYAAANAGAIRQVYPGRPSSIYPPCAFVDAINEGTILFTAGPTQRNPSIELVLIQGIFDTEEATDKQDSLVDGMIDYLRTHIHQAGTSSLISDVSYTDVPGYQPEWILDAPIYYATRFTFTGLRLEAAATL